MIFQLPNIEIYFTTGSLSDLNRRWFTFDKDAHNKGTDYHFKLMGVYIIVSRNYEIRKRDRGI